MNVNVFSSLFKYSGASENYLTEALVFMIKLLLERNPTLGLSLVNLLCDQPGEACFADLSSVIVSTQVTTEQGRPDIEIYDEASSLVYVEVKLDSSLGVNQLERYQEQLLESGVPNTRLTFLTRSRSAAHGTTLRPEEYHHLCWYEIYNWLSGLDTEDTVIQYFAGSFMGFLEEMKMSMERVGWEYIQGVPAMLKLVDMLEVALTEVLPGERLTKTAGWGWRGFRLLEDYWCGLRYELPLVVVFENNRGNSPVTHKVDLDLEREHFFSLTKDEQLERLVTFIGQAAKGITLPDGTVQE